MATVPPGSSTVEITLELDGEGTRLREHYLGRLAVRAEGGDPGRDDWMEAPQA